MIGAIRGINYQGGPNNIHVALDTLVNQAMTETSGARPDRPHVALLITIGLVIILSYIEIKGVIE